MTETDRALVARAQSGDSGALQDLLERYQPRLLRFGLRMCGHREDAEDVVQESMMAAARTLSDFRGDASLSTWLYTIARSFCLKKRRRSKFAPAHEASLDDEDTRPQVRAVADPSRSPEEAAAISEVESAVQAAIRTLEDGQREVLVLRDVEGLSAKEVGEVTGLSVSAVKSKLHRARSNLRRTLDPVLGEIDARNGLPTADCPDIEALFSKSLEGEIDAELCGRMQQHVDACPRCRQTCEGLSLVLKTCQATPTPEVPPNVQASVRRAVRMLNRRD
ncbi:MAG: sigma-70 family RNA polymerase sigma factor [Myxococcota bacterium]